MRADDALEIREVKTTADVEAFVRLPERLYVDDPNYIAPLRKMVRDKLDKRKNPFFLNGEAAFFLARRDGTDVGRISAQLHYGHIKRYRDATGHFGFLAAENDFDVVSHLLDTAEAWARRRGLKRLTGPFSLNINDESGLLVDGSDTPPTMMMAHDPPYLGGVIEAHGYTKLRDLFCYRFEFAGQPPDKIARLANLNQGIEGLVVRRIKMRDYRREAERIFAVFNEAWRDNWGFVPLSREEYQSIAKDMRLIIDPKMAWIAEIDGRAVGMIVMIPDLNNVIRDIGPAPSLLSWLRIAYRLKFKRISVARVILAGVSSELATVPLRSLILAMLSTRMFEANRTRIHGTIELGWMLEENACVLSWMRALEAERAKTYRLYEKKLGPDQ